MAYDEQLAERARRVLGRHDGITERRMFGGLAFMFHGNMCAGILGDELMVRVGPEADAWALEQPHTRVMDFTGRVSRGIVMVDPVGTSEDEDLTTWVERGLDFAGSLPPK